MLNGINKKIFFYFLAYLFLDALLKLIYNTHIISEKLLIEHYYNLFSESSVEQNFKQSNENIGLGFLISGITTTIRVLLIALLIYLNKFLFNLNINYKNILLIVIKSYFIFLIPGFIQIFWFSIAKDQYTIDDLMNFNWHTLLFWINDLKYGFLRYPLAVFNLFEVIFWVLLAILLKNHSKLSFWISLRAVLFTYGVGLLIWVVFVMFLFVIVS